MPADHWMEGLLELIEDQNHQDQLKFKVYTSDLMTKVIRKLEVILGKKGIPAAEKGESVTDHDRKISRSKHILDNISAQVFTQRTGLPIAYRKTMAVFEDIVEARNQVCYDTEFEFARLLLTRQFKDPVIAQKFNCDH